MQKLEKIPVWIKMTDRDFEEGTAL